MSGERRICDYDIKVVSELQAIVIEAQAAAIWVRALARNSGT